MAAEPAPKQSWKVHEKAGWLDTMMEALALKHKEAAEDGSGEYLEDLLDMTWTSIPSEDKEQLMVVSGDRKGKLSAADAWDAAETMQPKEDLSREDRRSDPINRQRVKRKAQIITDALQALNLLYKKPPVGRQVDTDGSDYIDWGDDSE